MSWFGGDLGGFQARTFLSMLEKSAASGTLCFSQGTSCSLILLRAGKPLVHHDLGVTFDIDERGSRFDFWAHSESYMLPTIPSRYPRARGALWALPPFAYLLLGSSQEIDLSALSKRLCGAGFTGAVILNAEASQGLLLLLAGKVVGALHENEAQPASSGMVALGSLLAHEGEAEVAVSALPEAVVRALLGWLLRLEAPLQKSGLPADFTGLELTPMGARYYLSGRSYLQVVHPLGAPVSGAYAACEAPPELTLPDVGTQAQWLTRRYQLTLRGKDALNPMTDTAMQFVSDYGEEGRLLLAQLRDTVAMETIQSRLAMEHEILRNLIERMELEGLLRRVDDRRYLGGLSSVFVH